MVLNFRDSTSGIILPQSRREQTCDLSASSFFSLFPFAPLIEPWYAVDPENWAARQARVLLLR